MASLPATESDYTFLEKPSEDFFCAVTFDFLKEPHQTLCCGNHLSQETVTRLQGQPCPVCKKPNLNTVPDKFFKRKVNELKVCCPNKSLGCEWVGELCSLNRHLSQNSVEGECQFVTVACPYSCGDLMRCQLTGHKANDCPNRPFTCIYCNHKATFIEVTEEHWPLCKQYPFKCPNKCCVNTIERQNLPKHLQKICPLQVIRCEFSYAGCEVECQRQHMQTHLGENVVAHLTKFSHTLHQQSINEQLQKQTVALMSAITRLALDVQKPLAPIFVTPSDIAMTNFEEHKKQYDVWYSPPFYSHIGGYKICLRVDANGLGDAKGTHVSVYVHLMRGKYDDQLKWPFRGDIMIQLLNQERDGGHLEKTLSFNDRTDDHVVARVVDPEQERATGWGYPKFVAHNELSAEDKEYLKNDCLKFRVSKTVVKSV